MSWWAAKTLTRELESVTRQLRLWKPHLRCRVESRLGRSVIADPVVPEWSETGPWDLARNISHQSGNHLTNRHCQPAPTWGQSLLSLLSLHADLGLSSAPRCGQAGEVRSAKWKLSSDCQFWRQKFKFPSFAFYFPTWRGPVWCLVPGPATAPLSLQPSNITGLSAGRHSLIPRNTTLSTLSRLAQFVILILNHTKNSLPSVFLTLGLDITSITECPLSINSFPGKWRGLNDHKYNWR